MESVVQYFASQGLDFWGIMKLCIIMLGSTLIITLLGRFIFGKHSIINCAISSAIGILFVYTVEIILYTFPNRFSTYITPLPFTTAVGNSLHFFKFQGAPYTAVCSQILSMIILAFIMNIIDRWIAKGKNIIVWLFFRILTLIAAIAAHGFILKLFTNLMPEGLVTHAPAILLGILIVMLLTGALKLVVGAAMAAVNPLIAALYTFFFASIIGKQVTTAVVTAAILSGFVYVMESLHISVISIAPAALIAYIPLAVILLPMWYTTHKNMEN